MNLEPGYDLSSISRLLNLLSSPEAIDPSPSFDATMPPSGWEPRYCLNTLCDTFHRRAFPHYNPFMKYSSLTGPSAETQRVQPHRAGVRDQIRQIDRTGGSTIHHQLKSVSCLLSLATAISHSGKLVVSLLRVCIPSYRQGDLSQVALVD